MPNYNVGVILAGGRHTERYNGTWDDPKAAAKACADKWTKDVESRIKKEKATGARLRELESVRVPSFVEVHDTKTYKVIASFKVSEI